VRSRALPAFVIVSLAAAAWVLWSGRFPEISRLLDLRTLLTMTPHEAYAASLRSAGLAEAPLGRQWLAAAEQSLAQPTHVTLPRREAIWFAAADPRALAFSADLRRGQRIVVDASVETASPLRVFVDVFGRDDDGVDHLASAEESDSRVEVEIRRDGRYVLRVQPELLQDARVTLTWRTEPTLNLPVQGAQRSDIQSYFLAPRNGGRREHHGVDIFASHGTPVVAAADGVVSSVGTNNLGGNVVWVARPLRGEAHYYAHLDTQLAAAGTRVSAGDVLGTVGTTGNARGGPPHLHFGIYSARAPVDPLPYIEPGAATPTTTADGGRLGELVRLRTTQRIALTGARAAPNTPRQASGTPLRIVGASPRTLRVQLPDGAEGYVAPGAVETAERPLRIMRLTAPVMIASGPARSVTIETLQPRTRLDVLGRFGGSLFVRRADGLTGWIPTGAPQPPVPQSQS
jgi:murein DD-endopeptidase MepM/ murein hydrolase activator NlpD